VVLKLTGSVVLKLAGSVVLKKIFKDFAMISYLKDA
jgi:hypothetical protein